MDICLTSEIELKMPESVVEIDVVHTEEGVFFHMFFCCLKPSIDGFLNGCRPFFILTQRLSVVDGMATCLQLQHWTGTIGCF